METLSKKRRFKGEFIGNSTLMKIEDTINKEQLVYFIINNKQTYYTKEDVLKVISKLHEFETDNLEKSEFNYLS